jgi:ankyrin repeat protein
MVAAEEGFEGTVRLLLRRGARPDLKNHAGHTALMYAASTNHRELVRLLLEADPGILDRDLSHLLKLASKNFTPRTATDGVFTPSLIAEEMVRLGREMGLLGGLLALARQRGKVNVLQLLYRAIKQLDMESEDAHEMSGS